MESDSHWGLSLLKTRVLPPLTIRRRDCVQGHRVFPIETTIPLSLVSFGQEVW